MNATEALKSRDPIAAKKVIDGDKELDALELEID